MQTDAATEMIRFDFCRLTVLFFFIFDLVFLSIFPVVCLPGTYNYCKVHMHECALLEQPFCLLGTSPTHRLLNELLYKMLPHPV